MASASQLRPTAAAVLGGADGASADDTGAEKEGDIIYLSSRGDWMRVISWGVIHPTSACVCDVPEEGGIIPYDRCGNVYLPCMVIPHGWAVRSSVGGYTWLCRCFVAPGSRYMRFSVSCSAHKWPKKIFHAASGSTPREALSLMRSVVRIPRAATAERIFGLTYEATQLGAFYRSERLAPPSEDGMGEWEGMVEGRARRSGSSRSGMNNLSAWERAMRGLTAIPHDEAEGGMAPPKLRRVSRVVS